MQIALHQDGDALKLALDDSFQFIATLGQHHRLVTLAHLIGSLEEPARAETQRTCHRTRQCVQNAVHGSTPAIHENNQHRAQYHQRKTLITGHYHPPVTSHFCPPGGEL